MSSPSLSGRELLRINGNNEQIIKALQEEIANERTIADLKAEIAELKKRVKSGGNKRSNRRKHVKHNKNTRKGYRMHKKCV